LKVGRQQITVSTQRPRELIDVTAEVQACVERSGVREGSCLVFSPHTTVSVTINENVDAILADDLLRGFVEMLGDERRFRHAGGNGGAHVLASLVGSSVTVPVADGRLELGQWQAIYLCEWDGPRERTLRVWVSG
jgi:secondary thiamine-phosphate synthase enzyme